MSASRELVRALAGAGPLPEAAGAAARLHFLDALGAGLAAASASAGKPYRAYARGAAAGDATALGRAAGISAGEAALVNGGLIHSLEFDDTHAASIVHGSSVLAATALAAGEAAGASGAAILDAYARGWELLVRLGLAAPGAYQARGFQVTPVGGALAAAWLACRLRGLAEEQTVAAIGIALSQASGVMEFLSNGSSVKSLHPGWAAHAGLAAASLASAGMTGPETSLEGRFGFFRQFAGDAAAADRFSALMQDLGTRWHLQEAAFKFYPCCHYLHPFIEAAGKLAVSPDDVESIVCRVPAGEAPVICEPWATKRSPATPHAARWSLPVVVAARLVLGKVDFDFFEKEIEPEVLRFAQRISWQPLAGARFPERFEAELECSLRAGGTQRIRIEDVYGNPSRPAGRDAVLAKFRSNAARTLKAEAVDALIDAVERMEDSPSAGSLSAALRQVRDLSGRDAL